jgi:exopolyphosphatase / guanosine-5'-triphosphate,3'-diphosphate pyrophosphatase
LKISVIDLGFNSIKLVNYYVNPDNSYKAYEQQGIRVRLGANLRETGLLSRESINSTINALKLFRDKINLQSINYVVAVATSAVREADNKDDFLREVYQKTRFQFRVLSGKEEALFSYLGAIKSICIPTAVFFDLGGGSLEIVYTENYRIKQLMSLPLGSLRLSQIYSRKDGAYSKKNYLRMQSHILKTLPSSKELGKLTEATLIGVGGTLRSIAGYDQEIKNYALDKIHNYKIDYQSIECISRRLFNMTPCQIARIDAIGSNRAETITAGSCVINMLMRKLAFKKIVISTHGLREGVLSSFLEFPTPFYTENINKDHIQNFVRVGCKPEIIIPKSICSPIKPLTFTGLIKKQDYKILGHAIKEMSEIALTADLENVFHTIMDKDFRDLSHREQLLLALSIIYTRKPNIAKRFFTRYRQILKSRDKKYIKKIAACIGLSTLPERMKAKVK